MSKTEDSRSQEAFRVRKVGEEETLPFTAHLVELRYRLLVSLFTVFACIGICYFFIDRLIPIMEGPIQSAAPGLRMTFLAPAEGFFVSIKMAFYAGLFLAWPVIMYQAWVFISPGLRKKERRYAFPFALAGTIFFILGASFSYFIILPFGLKFLISFGQKYWIANITVNYYLSFAMKLTLAFGLVFQLPLIIAMLGRLGVVTARQLKRGRSYFIVLAFVIAAILTPPDVITQCLMAGPLIFLYELSIYVVLMLEKNDAGAEKKTG